MRLRSSPKREASEGSAAGRVVLVSVLWALVHTLLASKQAKDLARWVAGPHYRDGLYRVAYNAKAVVTLALAARWFFRLPDRELYSAKPPLSLLLRAGQAASLGVLFSGVRVIGVLDFAGITSLWNLLTRKDVNPEPEAQGPPMGADGEVVKAGAFRITRHPGNLGALGFFLFMPRMTVNRATLTALSALYTVLGSMHEEYRLRTSYGAAYERYQRTVPFFIPRPSSRR
jgi:hypothetical protein